MGILGRLGGVTADGGERGQWQRQFFGFARAADYLRRFDLGWLKVDKTSELFDAPRFFQLALRLHYLN